MYIIKGIQHGYPNNNEENLFTLSGTPTPREPSNTPINIKMDPKIKGT